MLCEKLLFINNNDNKTQKKHISLYNNKSLNYNETR